MNTFKPDMDILPQSQKKLWPKLKDVQELGYVLYGGTAIALRLGHRESVDFDFFSDKPLNKQLLQEKFDFTNNATTLQDSENTWVLLVPFDDAKNDFVKVSFFGGISFGRVGEPELTDDHVLQVAALDDLMATKLKVILQRAEAKDYRDIAVMIGAGINLEKGLASARLFFGTSFQPSESLKALTYFGDGDLHTLTNEEKQTLLNAVANIEDLPRVALSAESLSMKSITPETSAKPKKSSPKMI